MPWEKIVGPLVEGVFGLGGGALQARAQDKATSASLAANREALAWEREKEATRRREWERAQVEYKNAMRVYNARRDLLAKRYGIELPDVSFEEYVDATATPERASGQPPSHRFDPLSPAPGNPTSPMPGGAGVSPVAPVQAPPTVRGMSLADMANRRGMDWESRFGRRMG